MSTMSTTNPPTQSQRPRIPPTLPYTLPPYLLDTLHASLLSSPTTPIPHLQSTLATTLASSGWSAALERYIRAAVVEAEARYPTPVLPARQRNGIDTGRSGESSRSDGVARASTGALAHRATTTTTTTTTATLAPLTTPAQRAILAEQNQRRDQRIYEDVMVAVRNAISQRLDNDDGTEETEGGRGSGKGRLAVPHEVIEAGVRVLREELERTCDVVDL